MITNYSQPPSALTFEGLPYPPALQQTCFRVLQSLSHRYSWRSTRTTSTTGQLEYSSPDRCTSIFTRHIGSSRCRSPPITGQGKRGLDTRGQPRHPSPPVNASNTGATVCLPLALITSYTKRYR
ncbi:Hypothetical predicted protein [Pelobates cultripes]|uniref:Uncharacterized protein n=1 Tax=Pelobates cultripes TaxID=61616 RepID=A0AAD1TIE8_PELCU|nr:Hypothetical predicted protein [Pelobates cultripes]